jgi:anti-sigma regulatory factor (Ser/Thr protein kinase)
VNGHSTLRFPSDPSLFGTVRRLVAQTVKLSGGSDEDALELEIATGEVLANVYRHAYRQMPGPLQVDLAFDDQKVEVSVHDDGEGSVGPLNIPRAIGTEDEHRGLFLVGKITDHAEILHPRNERGGTTVRMIKRIRRFRRFTNGLRTRGGLRGFAWR